MDALKLRIRAKDQLHPLLQDLVTGYARFKGSKEWEGRSKMVSWYGFPPSHGGLVPDHVTQVDHSERHEGLGGAHRRAVTSGAPPLFFREELS
jgi:hypothetical protein